MELFKPLDRRYHGQVLAGVVAVVALSPEPPQVSSSLFKSLQASVKMVMRQCSQLQPRCPIGGAMSNLYAREQLSVHVRESMRPHAAGGIQLAAWVSGVRMYGDEATGPAGIGRYRGLGH